MFVMNSYYVAVLLMKMMLPLLKEKLDSCKEFMLNICCID